VAVIVLNSSLSAVTVATTAGEMGSAYEYYCYYCGVVITAAAAQSQTHCDSCTPYAEQ
jgi:hypothetical protein